jgi:hypothetical protein
MADVVVFKWGKDEVALNRVDAFEIRERAVPGASLGARPLRDRLSQALDADSERAEIDLNKCDPEARESIRYELVLILTAIDDADLLLGELRTLRKIVQSRSCPKKWGQCSASPS